MDKYTKSRSGSTHYSGSDDQLLSLELSHQRYKSLVESTNDWIWEIDKNGLYTYVSPQVLKILGFHPDEIIGKSPFDLMPADEAIRIRNIFKPIFNLKKPFKLLENINLHKKGYEVYLETSGAPFFDSNNLFAGYRGVDRDISSRKELERERDNLLLAMDQMSEAALVIKPDLSINYLNKTFYDLFGYTPESIIGKPLTVLDVPEQKAKKQTPAIMSKIAQKGSWSGEVKRRAATGENIPVFLNAQSTYDEKKQLTGYVGCYFDLRDIKKATRELEQSLTETVLAIATTIEKRDPYTFGHQNRVSELSVAIARKFGKDNDFVKGLKLSAIIHDIGKIFIPSEILNRPGKLSPEEFNLIKTHSKVGYDIIKDIEFPWPVKEIVLSHHEKLDGSGYPIGLLENEICEEAQILAVADVVEAVSSHRPYRPALGIEKGLEIIQEGDKTQYNSDVINACRELIEKEGFEFTA